MHGLCRHQIPGKLMNLSSQLLLCF
uniref:Uncharacterized protein n=1 Tax=Rhizophora mucronata TaxID=61149 RepID=A0A2P2NDH1_RHIMU